MRSAGFTVAFVFIAATFPVETWTAAGCGGLLDDVTGEYHFHGGRVAASAPTESSTCIWILKTGGEGIDFTLEKLNGPSSLIIHQNQGLHFRPVKFDRNKDIGSSVDLKGDTILIVLGGVTAATEFSFSWDSKGFDSDVIATKTSVYYVNDQEGQLIVRRANRGRKLLWLVKENVEVGLGADFDEQLCGSEVDSCECYVIMLFEVLRNGKLRETMRHCGPMMNIRPETVQNPLVVFAFINGTKEHRDTADYLQLSWSHPTAVSTTGIIESHPRSLEVAGSIEKWNNESGSELISKEEDETFSSTELEQHGEEGCGGLVLLPFEGVAEIQYKIDENYGNLERCIWTLKGDSRMHRITIHVDYQGFTDEADGLLFYYVDEKSKNFKGIKILHSDTGKNLTFHTRQALLFFSSDASGTSHGFRLLLSSLQFGMGAGHEAVVSFTAPYGFYFYPEKPGDYYDGDDWLGVVIQGTKTKSSNRLVPISVTLSFLDIEDDFLYIYTLLPYDSTSHHGNSTNLLLNGRYTGSIPNGIDNVTTSAEPRLLFFTTNGYLSGRGFQLLWYPSALIK